MIKNLGKTNSLFNQFITEIRDVKIQKDPLRFRRNLERIGEVFAYEISKLLTYESRDVKTSLGECTIPGIVQQPVIASILRAGLPMHNGLLNYFDGAQNAFISAFRKYSNDMDFEIKIEYVSCPVLDDKVLIISDPMMATAGSMVLSYKALLEFGRPKHIHFVTAIASKEGLQQLKKKVYGIGHTFWVGAIDDELTAKSYIVPGLGDAGDLAFGSKE